MYETDSTEVIVTRKNDYYFRDWDPDTTSSASDYPEINVKEGGTVTSTGKAWIPGVSESPLLQLGDTPNPVIGDRHVPAPLCRLEACGPRDAPYGSSGFWKMAGSISGLITKRFTVISASKAGLCKRTTLGKRNPSTVIKL